METKHGQRQKGGKEYEHERMDMWGKQNLCQEESYISNERFYTGGEWRKGRNTKYWQMELLHIVKLPLKGLPTYKYWCLHLRNGKPKLRVSGLCFGSTTRKWQNWDRSADLSGSRAQVLSWMTMCFRNNTLEPTCLTTMMETKKTWSQKSNWGPTNWAERKW